MIGGQNELSQLRFIWQKLRTGIKVQLRMSKNDHCGIEDVQVAGCMNVDPVVRVQNPISGYLTEIYESGYY